MNCKQVLSQRSQFFHSRLFYNAMRYGMDYRDPGADHYEQEYRARVIKQLHRRAAQFGFALQPQNTPDSMGVS